MSTNPSSHGSTSKTSIQLQSPIHHISLFTHLSAIISTPAIQPAPTDSSGTEATVIIPSITLQPSTLLGPFSTDIIPTSTDKLNTPTIASDMAQHKPMHIGEIAGGIVAGTIATILVLVLMIYRLRRIRRKRDADDIDLLDGSSGLDILEPLSMVVQPYSLPQSPHISKENPSRPLISKLNAGQYFSGSHPTGANIQVHQDTQSFDPSGSNSLSTYDIAHGPEIHETRAPITPFVPQNTDPQSALALSHLKLAAQVDALQNQLLQMQMQASTSHYFPNSSIEVPPSYFSESIARSESDRTLFDEEETRSTQVMGAYISNDKRGNP